MKRTRSLANKTRPTEPVPLDFDVIIAADMTRKGDRAFRLAQEIRSFAAQGRRVALIQAAVPSEQDRIAAEIQTCVRRGLASVISGPATQRVATLVVHAASEIAFGARPLSGIKATNAVVVCYSKDDHVQGLSDHLAGCKRVTVKAVNQWVPRDTNVRRRGEHWRPMMSAVPLTPRKVPSSRPRIGWIETTGSPPPSSATFEIVRLDERRLSRISLDRLGLIDGLAYFPEVGTFDLLDTVVSAALAMGIRVALPSWLRSHFGNTAIYCTQEVAIPGLLDAIESEAVKGLEDPSPQSPLASSPLRPVMFVPSNGVGVGHVSRLLAVARRLDPKVPVIFATQAQAVPVIEKMGYRADYIPSYGYVGGDFQLWDDWYRHDLEVLIDTYDPALVVYDGNNPSDGLINAVASRRDCQLAWIRRGLWGNLTSPFIDNAKWFNLIVEPGELEGLADEGITGRRRPETLPVSPIRLLDEDELLSRAEAIAQLGLDAGRPAVLVQLGAGYNRDVVGLIDEIVDVLQTVPSLQICIAEWVNGEQALNYWPNVTYLRGFPLSQYFRAFDFSIAAAGYNTFHEIINFDLPTVFIPNRHPTMDDQAARAVHAQDSRAAFELDEADLGDLPELVRLLLDQKARDFLISNSRTFHSSNGAVEAAKALSELIGVSL